MDDATSSPSDSASANSSTSSTTATAAVTTSERAFPVKPRRLARGLNDLFSRQPSRPIPPSPRDATPLIDDSSAQAIITPVDLPETAAPVDASATDAATEAGASAASPAADSSIAPRVPNAPTISPVTQPTTVDASPAPTGFEYRFVQLISRLDATCNLLSDARQTHIVAAQRSGKIAWSVAAALAIVAGISLWWAGSIASWNSGQLDYEQKRSTLIEKKVQSLTEQNAVTSAANQSLTEQQQSLAKRYEAVQKQTEATRQELEILRTSLSKANVVIDELMAKPEVVEPVGDR